MSEEIIIQPELPKERKARPKATDDKYIRIADDAKIDEFRSVGEKVQKGEVKWGYFALDSGKGYHHFLILNKQII